MKLILKAREGLTQKKVTATRGGKTYQTTVYVREGEKPGKDKPAKKEEQPKEGGKKESQGNEAEVDEIAPFEIHVIPPDVFLSPGARFFRLGLTPDD